MSVELTEGVPGTGKTMRNVQEIKRLAEQGETVYLIDLEGDFPGLDVIRMTRNQKIVWLDMEDGTKIKQIVGEYINNINTSSHTREIPINFDWRHCEDGSYIFIDEAHYTFPATSNYNQAQIRQDILDLSTHRHRGMNIRLMSQSPIQIHWFVLKQVTLQHHLERVRGKEQCKVYTTDYYVEHKGFAGNADISTFDFDKSLYGIYSSAEFHDTRETRWDSKTLKLTKFAAVMGSLVLIAGVATYFADPLRIWGSDVNAQEVVVDEQIQSEEIAQEATLSDIKTPLRLEEINTDESTILTSEELDIPFGCILGKNGHKGKCFYYSGEVKLLTPFEYKKEAEKMYSRNNNS